jgi:hypothetical protein
MKSNYCELRRNKIYAEVYDELLDEELNMNNPSHNDKIKYWMEKKLKSSNFIQISNTFENHQDLMEDLILKIDADSNNNPNIQGNTLMMYADDNSMYELFYMEDLTKKIPEIELNEFGSITNIFLQPVCWTCGIFKSSYGSDGSIYSDTITKSDVIKLYIQNYYHKGVMLNPDGSMTELEFTGENPFNMIGNNFTQSNTLDLFGFNLVPWVEKTNGENTTSTQLNKNASKIIGSEIYSRVFLTIVCPNTNKKFWDITPTTINNILKIINNKEIQNKIQQEIEQAEININPFYFIKKYVK